jgi:hypothetical protein
MTNRDWRDDESVAHLPEIGIQSGEVRPNGPLPVVPHPAPPPTPPDAANPFGPVPEAPVVVVPEAVKPDAAKSSPYLLFRFFDYNVEPGKRYVYRVQLGLNNPNYKLKPTLLAEPKLADSMFLPTEWSKPSAAIAVSHDTRILAVSVKPGRARLEPQAQVLMVKWLQDKGVEVSKEYTVLRGQVANFTDTTTPQVTPRPPVGPPHGVPPGGHGRGAAGPAGRGNPMPPVAPVVQEGPITVHYFSDDIALDFRGGELLRGRKTGSLKLPAPAEILAVGPDGDLVLHDELDDKAAYRKLTAHEGEAQRPVGGHPGRLEGILGP